MRRATSRTVLASEPPLRASARGCGVPLGQRRVARFALRLPVLHDARCVGPTSAFSRLRTSTRASPVPGCVNRFRACAVGEIACFTAVRFASVGRTFSLGGHRGGLVVPVAMRACRTSDIPVASSPCADPLARSNTRESRRDRLTAHPRERCEQGRRSGMPSVLQGSLAPRRSLERPAQDLPGFAVWPPRARFSTPFHPRMPLRAPEGRAPVHAPRCQRESRFFEPRRRLPTSAT